MFLSDGEMDGMMEVVNDFIVSQFILDAYLV